VAAVLSLPAVVLSGAGMASAEPGIAAAAVSAETASSAYVGGDSSTGTSVASARVMSALPSCAEYDHSGRDAWVINKCTYTIHAKIIWAFAADTACYTLNAGQRLDSHRAAPARFDGAVSC
jgi:hypothetical protein